MSDDRFNILFLSNRNTARGLFAECAANRIGRGRFKAYSAGLRPSVELDPVAIDILRLSGYPVEDLRPKHWKEFAGPDAPPLDFVFALCDPDAGEELPRWPGRPITSDWRYPDPEKLQGEDWERRKAMSEILGGLERQFGAFMQLPFRSLDDMSLREQLRSIELNRAQAR